MPAATITGRTILSDGFFRLERIAIEQVRRNGERQALEREVYRNGPGAAVLPHDSARDTVLLVRQLRVATLVNGDARPMIECCAGIIDAGDTPETTARKEAEQELGVRLGALEAVATIYPSPGSCAETIALFLARYTAEDRVGAGGGLEAEGEDIGVLEVPRAEAMGWIGSGRLVDAKTIILLQALALR